VNVVRPMIQYTSLVDRITNDLQNQLAQGKLKPGERLPPERTLCVSFGVGRTTIREALKSLAVRGLITKKGRGVIVADPDTSSPPGVDLASLAARVNLKQLYEVRKLLEVKIAGWAAMRANSADLDLIRRSLDPAPSRENGNGSPNRDFHDALAGAAHNPALFQIYESGRTLFFRLPFFWKLFEEAEVKTVRARRHEMAHRWHQHILKAVERHDMTEAEGAMFQHLDIMEKDLLSRLGERNTDVEPENFYSHPMLTEIDTTNNENLTNRGLIR